MASLRKRTNGVWEIQFRDQYGRKKTITLSGSKYSESTAKLFQKAVAVLVSKKINDDPMPHKPTQAWVENAAPEIRTKLARFGLVRLPSTHTIQKLWDAFIDTHRGMNEDTMKTYIYAKERFFSFFKEPGELLDELTQDRMKKWKTFLAMEYISPRTKKPLGGPTIAGTISKVKAVFNWAIAMDWIEKSPLTGVSRGSFRNPEKDRFIKESEYQRIMSCCPCQDWCTIVALARKGGLHPCEILILRWAKIEMDGDRMHVYNPKTKRWRWVPIFVDVRNELERLLAMLENKDQEFVVNRYSNREDANLVTQFNRIAKRAGLEQMDRPFDNMRASRSVEIRKKFGPKAESEWIGHSTKVAFEHYFMVLEDEFAVAAGRKSTKDMDISPDCL